MKRIGIARIGLVAVSLTAAALTTAAHAEEGELVKGLLEGMGFIPGDKAAIDYRERAPLVLPPRMDLREPAAPGSVRARNPQWPNDPDVIARKRKEVQERTPITETEAYRMDTGENTRLTVQEIRGGRHAGAAMPTAPQSRSDSGWVHPDILREQHSRRSTVDATGGETKRRSLTEPPSAYRQSATGNAIKGSFEPQSRVDEADPKVFLSQQQKRN